MAFIKHVGKNNDRKVLVLYRQVPGEDHMCLVIYPEVLQAHWQDAIQKVVESDIGQTAEELAEALHRSFLPDGRPILATLHQERMIKKLRASDVIMTPNANSNIRLDELNKMLNEMKLGDEAIKKMALNDASRGLVDPQVKRQAEAEFKAGQQAQAQTQPFVAPPNGALSDREIAANKLFQANRMEAEAKQLIAEANRMKKEAAQMDPNVVAKEAPVINNSSDSMTAEAPKRRGRPAKTQVADAAQS